MKIKYTTGPPLVRMGAAGEFRIGEAKEVPSDLARQMLQKPALKWEAVEDPKPAETGRTKRSEAKEE